MKLKSDKAQYDSITVTLSYVRKPTVSHIVHTINENIDIASYKE